MWSKTEASKAAMKRGQLKSPLSAASAPAAATGATEAVKLKGRAISNQAPAWRRIFEVRLMLRSSSARLRRVSITASSVAVAPAVVATGDETATDAATGTRAGATLWLP